jgi:hypothetical protein
MGLLTRLLSLWHGGREGAWREAGAEWRILVDDVVLGVLCAPYLVDVVWVSLEIVALQEPGDARLFDDEFWRGNSWRLVDVQTGKPEPFAIASESGLDAARRRVAIRGLRIR